jgi:inhibitor of cysteine peptidase
MNRILAFPALLALAAATACARAEEPRAEQPSAHTDPSQTIRVSPGADVRLALRSNQSTGYQWVLVDSAALGPLRSAGSRYAVPRHLRDRDGAGGTETWTFRADGAGQGTVTLVYMRPWEPSTATDTSRFRVVVE